MLKKVKKVWGKNSGWKIESIVGRNFFLIGVFVVVFIITKKGGDLLSH